MPSHAGEASRMPCAGAYLGQSFRERVIEELYLNEQRIVAPSLGFDAARVLAHALRARRNEVGWAAGTVGLWAVGLPLTGGLPATCLLLSMGVSLSGEDKRAPFGRKAMALAARWLGRLLFAVFLVATVMIAFSGSHEPSYDPYGGGPDLKDFLL